MSIEEFGESMNNGPLVSILIPVYNGTHYLAEAINSALGQTYKNIEVLVINDGSNDLGNTRNVALSYGDKIRYFDKQNGGVGTALNFGIKEMRGDYFSWLSHDDVYLPHKVETQINYLKCINDKTSILYSDYCFIDESSNFVSDYKLRHVEPQSFRVHFAMGGLINGCTMLIPAVCFKECGLFKNQLKTTQDYDLWFRFTEKFNFIHLPEILVKFRRHPNQDTVKLRSLAIIECNNIYLHFIKSIKKREIRAAYDKPVPIYYFDFAKSMRSQGYKKAMRYGFLAGLLNFVSIKPKYLKGFIRDAIRLSKEVIK